MPTFDDYIAPLETQSRVLTARRDAALGEVKHVYAQFADREPNADEARLVSRAMAAHERASAELRDVETRLAEWRRIRAEEESIDMSLARTAPDPRTAPPLPAYDMVARVGQEERTYRPPERRGGRSHGPSFIKDLYDYQIRHDPGAGERIARHGREVEVEHPAMFGDGRSERAMTTGAVAGFVPPAYLVELFAEFARAGRPVANLCTPLPLPEFGMTVELTRVTTPTTTGVQATQNAALSNQDADDTPYSVPVATVGGFVDTSRQSIERGVFVEQVLLNDLAASYATSMDTQVVNGSGAAGQHLGLLNVASINAITYTDATPTIPELWPKLADAVGKVISQRFTGPTAMVSHPNLWAWLLAERDTTGRPMFEPEAVAFNPMGTTGAMDYQATAQGRVMVPFVASGGVPTNLGAGTNETRVIVADFRDIYLFEDENNAPAQLRFDAPGASTLTVRLVAYGYSALASARQPKAISVVSGTGLIVPAL